MPAARDLTGQVFGYWHVDAKTDRRDSTGSIIWACTCTRCNNKEEVSARHLTSGKSLSCGCLKRDLVAERSQRNLTGMKFGRLRAIRKTEERKNGCVIWECECECGNTVYVRAASLVQQNTKSCGCYNSELAPQTLRSQIAADITEGTKLSALNSTPPSDNTSGVRGVTYEKNTGRWRAAIGFKGTVYSLGSFRDMDLAVQARRAAEEIIWKPFLEERLGKYQNEAELKAKLREYLQAKIAEQIQMTKSV